MESGHDLGSRPHATRHGLTSRPRQSPLAQPHRFCINQNRENFERLFPRPDRARSGRCPAFSRSAKQKAHGHFPEKIRQTVGLAPEKTCQISEGTNQQIIVVIQSIAVEIHPKRIGIVPEGTRRNRTAGRAAGIGTIRTNRGGTPSPTGSAPTAADDRHHAPGFPHAPTQGIAETPWHPPGSSRPETLPSARRTKRNSASRRGQIIAFRLGAGRPLNQRYPPTGFCPAWITSRKPAPSSTLKSVN